jgi:hypothetical protein
VEGSLRFLCISLFPYFFIFKICFSTVGAIDPHGGRGGTPFKINFPKPQDPLPPLDFQKLYNNKFNKTFRFQITFQTNSKADVVTDLDALRNARARQEKEENVLKMEIRLVKARLRKVRLN